MADLSPGASSSAVQGAVKDEARADAFPDVERAVRRLTSAGTEQHVSERLSARLQVDERWHTETFSDQRADREAVETRRVVRTASLSQVRKPLYTDSVERWRHYESSLQPMFDAFSRHGVRLR